MFTMVIRMRIYESQDADHQAADQIFYHDVKPVHEKHGAEFIARYRDQQLRVVVMWRYADLASMQRIQQAVAEDPHTLNTRAQRRENGLHQLTFEEFILTETTV